MKKAINFILGGGLEEYLYIYTILYLYIFTSILYILLLLPKSLWQISLWLTIWLIMSEVVNRNSEKGFSANGMANKTSLWIYHTRLFHILFVLLLSIWPSVGTFTFPSYFHTPFLTSCFSLIRFAIFCLPSKGYFYLLFFSHGIP